MKPMDAPLPSFFRFGRLAALAGCLAAGLAAGHAALPSVKPLLESRWPTSPGGPAYDVKVAGNYAYVALGPGGLTVIDVSRSTNCVRVGGYDTRGWAYRRGGIGELRLRGGRL
jgi:hypothetical protein